MSAAAVAFPAVAWWVVSPTVALVIGWRRGHPWLGWLCGLVPIAGPFLAARLPRQ